MRWPVLLKPWNSIKSHTQHLFSIKWKFASFTVLLFVYCCKDKASIRIKIKDYTFQYCLWTAYSNVQYTSDIQKKKKEWKGLWPPQLQILAENCGRCVGLSRPQAVCKQSSLKKIRNKNMWMAHQCVTCIQSSSENEYIEKCLYCANQPKINQWVLYFNCIIINSPDSSCIFPVSSQMCRKG